MGQSTIDLERTIQPIEGMSSSELSECALSIEEPTWLSDNTETGSEEFNNGQLPQEC